MRRFFSGVAKFLAILFSIIFVITTIISLLLVSIDSRLLNVSTYKNAFAELQVYTKIPRIIAETIVLSASYNPCEQNPLQCENIPPEFQECVRRTVGDNRYDELISGNENPTEAEMQLIQPCIEQFGENISGLNWENPLPEAPSEVQQCTKQELGVQIYNSLFNNERNPTQDEKNRIVTCFNKHGISIDDNSGPPSFMRNITVSDWEEISSFIIPQEELKSLTEDVLEQFFSYIYGQTDTISISLVNIKERISGEQGLNAILKILNAQPPCTNEQITQFIIGENLVICRPPDEMLSQVTPKIEEQLYNIATDIPDQATLVKPNGAQLSEDSGPLGNNPIQALRLIRLILRISPDIPIGLLILVTLLAVRTLKNWLRWWGIPLLITGFSEIILTITASRSIERIWTLILVDKFPSYFSVDLVELIHDFLYSIAHSVFKVVILWGILLGLFGLAMFIGSFFIKAKEKQGVTI